MPIALEEYERLIYGLPDAFSAIRYSTLAVIRRETNSWRWPIFTFAYMTTLAYVGALVTYQVGIRLL